jgi:hypothetical protein
LCCFYVVLLLLGLDTSEVIMNNIVKAPEESDFPKMHLAVVDGDNHMESPYHYHSKEKELNIAFVNPYTKEEFEDDVQFVLEVEGPAEFIDGGSIGCEGNRRIAARLLDTTIVILKINDASATLKVWAGWATGQNAVQLTNNLILEPHSNTTAEGNGDSVVDAKVLAAEMVKKQGNDTVVQADEVVNSEPGNPELVDEGDAEKLIVNGEALVEKEYDPSGKKDKIEQIKRFQNKPKGTPADGSESDEKLLGHKKESRQHHKHALKMEKEERQQEIDNLKEKIKDMHPMKKASHVHKAIKEMTNTLKDKYEYGGGGMKRKSFREKYESDSFADQLDMQRHIVACIFFVIAMGYIMFFHGRRRGVKGRRDL